MNLPRIPSTVRFPMGYTVKIKRVPAEDIPPSCLATWDEETQVIRLRKGRDLIELWHDLIHEMGHVYVDWMRHVEKQLEKALDVAAEKETEKNKVPNGTS